MTTCFEYCQLYLKEEQFVWRVRDTRRLELQSSSRFITIKSEFMLKVNNSGTWLLENAEMLVTITVSKGQLRLSFVSSKNELDCESLVV